MERFEAELQSFGNGAAIEVPFDVPAIFGAKRVPVVCTANGVAFRTTVATYGGRYYIGFNREVRERAGLTIGDRLSVALERDESPREVDLPAELEAVLSRRLGGPDDVRDALPHPSQGVRGVGGRGEARRDAPTARRARRGDAQERGAPPLSKGGLTFSCALRCPSTEGCSRGRCPRRRSPAA